MVVRELNVEELEQLQKDFRSFIQPHLVGENEEDYELVWQWEKFVFDKNQRVLDSKE